MAGITPLPPAPDRSQPADFSDKADALLGALDQFVAEANAFEIAGTLSEVQDTSASSVLIGTGAKVFEITAGKSFLAGMSLIIADTAAPSSNTMTGTITSYSGITLTMDITSVEGSGTKSAWTIWQAGTSGAAAATPGRINKTEADNPYVLVADDLQGVTTITNTGAAAETLLAVPAGSDGDIFGPILITAAQYVRITCDGSEKIRYGSIQSVAGGYIRANAVGVLFGGRWSGTEWVVDTLFPIGSTLNIDE
ncbi:MAG: hypothetical protein JRC86_00460 [Deltaproteobacteria bacterium]|nr:hypothetical protein [Deltaproteobacteria bacterium]